MFGNNPFITKKDSLVEAVQKAQRDGDMRRQAVAQVNEAFGVYSRNAVVRENLAAYDAAIEEAYKCMKEGDVENIMNPNSNWAKKQAADKSNPFNEPTPDPAKVAPNIMMTGAGGDGTRTIGDKVKSLFKEGKKADKDYDKDGKIESPKDEVWGSRLRAAKMAGKLKEEEQIDEISKYLAGNYIKAAQKDVVRHSQAAGYQAALADKVRSRKRAIPFWKKDFEERLKSRKREKGIERATNKLVGTRIRVPANEETLDETRMPASVIKHKQRIANMTPEEKAKKFAGKSDEQLKSMARRHGYGKDSNEYSKHVKEEQIDEISDALKARYLKKNVKDQEKNLKGYHKAAGKGDDAKADKYDRRIAKREHGYAMATKEEIDYSAQDRAPVTKSTPKEDPSTPKSYPGAASSLTPGNPTSQRMSNAVKPKLQEAVSRKHFQQVADLIKGHESQEKRNELATHHAGIFAKQNPRFNHEKFHAAAGSTAHQQKKVDEAAYSAKAGRAGKDLGKPGKNFAKIAKKAGAKHMKEDASF